MHLFIQLGEIRFDFLFSVLDGILEDITESKTFRHSFRSAEISNSGHGLSGRSMQKRDILTSVEFGEWLHYKAWSKLVKYKTLGLVGVRKSPFPTPPRPPPLSFDLVIPVLTGTVSYLEFHTAK